MSSTVLATKLFAPVKRRQVVSRPRLVRQLDAALEPGRKLAVISAPAGFGKTTLVSEWTFHSEGLHLVQGVAWLSLDVGDNEVPRLLTHLGAALQSVDGDVGSDALSLVHSDQGYEACLTALINDLVRVTRPIVLVLDDYHLVEAGVVHEAVAFLLDHQPPQLRIIIASRADPPLPLARLRARDELVELRADDLRFTAGEARTFLNEVMTLGLSASDLGALKTRTEGWVTGLQLVALSLRGRDDVSEFIGAFTGSHRLVLDYLTDEVLAHQPNDVRDFLLHTSVLDRLNGPLCDALTGRGDGAATLDSLERADVFVVPLDESREWFRYHHLFADVLRTRLLGEQSELVPVLHRRASEWCGDHGLVEEAVRHALAASDIERAVHLMELALPALRRSRQDWVLIGWLEDLPDAAVRRSAVLSVFYGWMLMVTGDLHAVEGRLNDAERALASVKNRESGNEELRTLPMTLAIYRASLAQARGDSAGTTRHAQHALDLAGPSDHLARGSAAGFLGLAAWARGDIRAALPTFSEAVESLHLAGNLADALSSTVVLADMWFTSGRPDKAGKLYEAALREADERAATHAAAPLPTADLHVGLGELDCERGLLKRAVQHLDTAKRLGEVKATTGNLHRWFLAMARVRRVGGDPAGAMELLGEAELRYRRGFLPDLRPIPAMTARIQIAEGHLAEVGMWADASGVSAQEDASYLREYEHLTLVRLLMAQHRAHEQPTAIHEATGLLDRLLLAAEESGRTGSLIEILMLQALAHAAQEDWLPAMDALERALTQAPDEYVRLFLDEGAPLMGLLRHAEERGVARERTQRLLKLPPHPRLPPWHSDGEAEWSPASLSHRELQVLRLLQGTMTAPEIARELFVSHNTMRTHTKHIFTKLGVNSRQAAVSRAKAQGLL